MKIKYRRKNNSERKYELNESPVLIYIQILIFKWKNENELNRIIGFLKENGTNENFVSSLNFDFMFN